MTFKILKFDYLEDSPMYLDEQGYWYEDHEELIDFLCEPHEENILIHTVFEEDLDDRNEDPFLYSIYCLMMDSDFDLNFEEAFELAWNFEGGI